ncbi:MBL fold metallo-hydrolase [uncultured Microscilla sp.]|uniref:MBL fold metallo-hydrolase n=1 Tax=uncultured Microscilla sp. TaxID=432653 RepID=UPI00260266BB|nr:MBL fold metallo-hydrolase [uncultured Microscilla sp.]
MSKVKHFEHQEVKAFKLGHAYWGKPLIWVHVYWLDGLLIDSGQRKMQKHLLALLKDLPVQQIALTHHHEDHSGNIKALQQYYQVPVWAGDKTRQLVASGFKIKNYQKFVFGNMPPTDQLLPLPDQITTDKYQLSPIFTPGHAQDHYAFYEAQQGWLFSGDLYLGKIKYIRQDENVPQMIASIKKVLQYDFDVLFCAHHPRLTNGKQHMRHKLQYLEDLSGKIHQLHAQGNGIQQIIKKLHRKEIRLGKLITSNDIGVDYLVRSILKDKALHEQT